MFFLIAFGFWLLIAGLALLFCSCAARLGNRADRLADRALLTRQERRDGGIAEVHLFPTSRSHS